MYFDTVKSLIEIHNVDPVLWAKKELFFLDQPYNANWSDKHKRIFENTLVSHSSFILKHF